jgi:quinol monooxygenase YgiN
MPSQEAIAMIVLIVHATIKPGTEEAYKHVCREVTEPSRQEPGCLLYVIHQSTENPLHFAFYEQYADQAALDAHRASPHFARYRAGIEGLVASRSPELFVPIA